LPSNFDVKAQEIKNEDRMEPQHWIVLVAVFSLIVDSEEALMERKALMECSGNAEAFLLFADSCLTDAKIVIVTCHHSQARGP
jgi:hypothetical protein